MTTTHRFHAEFALLSALTIVFSALVAGTIWASPPVSADSMGEPLEATILSRHRQPIVVHAWAGAKMYRLGAVPPNQRRTFELPAVISPGVKYQLVSDCGNAHRIVSEPIVAAADRHPEFTISLNQGSSFLRLKQERPSGR